MNSPKSQGHGAKTHPGAELQTVGIRWVCLNLTQSFCSSCFPPDPSAPHEALEPPILVPCDLNGIIHLSSPGWLELYLNIVENTTTLSAFSFFSLFLTILTLHPLANLPVFTPPGYAEVPDFFSPLIRLKHALLCSSISKPSAFCVSAGPLWTPRCHPGPSEQVAEDLVQSSSELFYFTHFSANSFKKPIFSIHQITLHI